MKKLYFITKNKEKLFRAKNILMKYDIDVCQKEINCKEIQDDDLKNIAIFSSKYASDYLKLDVVKTDSGLFIEALNGFPGPYSSYIEEKLKADDILKLMNDISNRRAYYREVIAYCKYGENPVTFESVTQGRIADEVSGFFGKNFDYIFMCMNDNKTMANYKGFFRLRKYNVDGWIKFAKFYNQKILNRNILSD